MTDILSKLYLGSRGVGGEGVTFERGEIPEIEEIYQSGNFVA